jgi:hypothetical protein
MILLYNWGSFNILPGCANSERMRKLKAVPAKPAHIPNKRYKVPISLCLVEYNHREIQVL